MNLLIFLVGIINPCNRNKYYLNKYYLNKYLKENYYEIKYD